jgi:two-component system sensor histidine kinase DegS
VFFSCGATAKEPQLAEGAQDPVQAFLEECLEERKQVAQQLEEVELLIRQSTDEVERLARRSAEVTNRLRQVENNFDTVPRADLQEIYSTDKKEQGRLFTMRGQAEKLQANQEGLRKRHELLTRVVSVLRLLKEESSATATNAPFTREQSMVVRIIQAQENERRRLSRQMHDGPAQLLTNLVLQAEICQRLLDVDSERARAELDNLKTETTKAFQQTREFISDLRPMMLDDLGLIPTLKRYVSSWSEKTGISAELSISGQPHRLAPYSEVTIFRAVQELMGNAAQHANPSHVQVMLSLDGAFARAVVEDDGVGFDVDEVMASVDTEKKIGIASIADRVQMLGGSLSFESVRGVGTKATLEVPET